MPTYRKAGWLERMGWTPAPSPPTMKAQRRFNPDADETAVLCRKMEALGARFNDCSAHLSNIAQLDGARLWGLRRACMLEAEDLKAAYRCNRAHYPHWPEADGSATP